MSANHNRIKVADLETNQPNKILITNQNGELEFNDVNNIKNENYNALDYTTEGKALDARQGKVLKDLIDNKTVDLATDAEAQINSAVPEDKKVISRSKLFNWWNWAKSQTQTISGIWNFTNKITLAFGTKDTPPLIIPAGILTTTAQNGAIERDTNGKLWETHDNIRNQIATLDFVEQAETNNMKLTGDQIFSGVKTATNTSYPQNAGIVINNTSDNSSSKNIILFSNSGTGLFCNNLTGTGIFSQTTSGYAGNFFCNGNGTALNVQSPNSSNKTAIVTGNTSNDNVYITNNGTGANIKSISTGTGLVFAGNNGAGNTSTISKEGYITAKSIELGSGTIQKPSMVIPNGILTSTPQNGAIERDENGKLWNTFSGVRKELVPTRFSKNIGGFVNSMSYFFNKPASAKNDIIELYNSSAGASKIYPSNFNSRDDMFIGDIVDSELIMLSTGGATSFTLRFEAWSAASNGASPTLYNTFDYQWDASTIKCISVQIIYRRINSNMSTYGNLGGYSILINNDYKGGINNIYDYGNNDLRIKLVNNTPGTNNAYISPIKAINHFIPIF